MRRILLSLLLLLLLPLTHGAHADESPRPALSISATGALEIGPDGRVVSWTLDSGQPGAPVEALLQRNIEQWRFEPVVEDGKPVIARTRMSVVPAAAPQGDDYLMKVESVHFGPSRAHGPVSRIDAATLQDGQPAGLDSPFRLRNDVLGKTL